MEKPKSSSDEIEGFRQTKNVDAQVATTSNHMMQQGVLINEVLNVDKCKQYPVILKNCKDIHIGPKIELHSEQQKNNCLKERNEGKNDLFISCCKKLKNRYETYFAYMRSFLWEGKRNDFPLKDYFVQLTVEKADLFGKKSGEKIDLNDIFSKQQDAHQTILVTGDPGYGKTTLCKKIAYDWSSKEYLQHFDLTVVIILRELGNKGIKDTLLHEIQDTQSDGKLNIQEENLNILVILDGFDELIEKDKVVKFIREETFDISHRMTILITSRPQATEKIREDMRLRFSIEGFSTEHQEKYIRLMFSEDEKKAKELICKLHEDDFFKEIAECPLMLHMLCSLHQNGDMEKIESVTDLYVRIFCLITQRYIRKADPVNRNSNLKRGKYFLGEKLLFRLGKLNINTYPITTEILKKSFPKKEEYNFILSLDLLVVNSFVEYGNSVRYDFLHRTFSEFLVALTVYNDFSCFSMTSSDNMLLFIMGFYGSDSFPKKFLCHLKERVFTPKFMVQVHKEIKIKKNWEQFCSISKVKFYDTELQEIKELLKLYDFKKLYFCFSETKEDYEDKKNELLDFYNNFNFPNNIKIYLFLIILTETWENSHDIRESVSCIIDFFHNVKLTNYEIHFIGIYHFIDTFYCFRNVNYTLNLPDDFMLELYAWREEELIALQTLNSEGTVNTYFLSLEQYEILCDRIKVYRIRNGCSKCTII